MFGIKKVFHQLYAPRLQPPIHLRVVVELTRLSVLRYIYVTHVSALILFRFTYLELSNGSRDADMIQYPYLSAVGTDFSMGIGFAIVKIALPWRGRTWG